MLVYFSEGKFTGFFIGRSVLAAVLSIDPDQLSLNGRVEGLAPEPGAAPHIVLLQTRAQVLLHVGIKLLHERKIRM